MYRLVHMRLYLSEFLVGYVARNVEGLIREGG